MGTINSGGLLWTTQITTAANTTNVYTPIAINPGYLNSGYYVPGSYDPLAAPRPESNEEWLRRRVREVQWKPA